MKIDLSGKLAVVTGSSTGIGWGCAAGLVAAGATVVLCGQHQEKLTTALNRLLDISKRADVRTIACDLSSPSGCEALLKAQPTCDILVNNLGVWEPKPFFELADMDWAFTVFTGRPGLSLYATGNDRRGKCIACNATDLH